MNRHLFYFALAAVLVASACEKSTLVPEFAKDAVSLSTNGTANCYIVKPASSVSFPVAYKGNSTSDAISGGSSVKVVWQDVKGLVKELWYDSAAKVAYASVSDASGNAVVALCSETGEILWSWHLWVCDYDPSKTLFTTAANESGTTWTFMDRNLGALTTSHEGFGSHGLIYQWGRKDPFPGAVTYTKQNEDYSYITDGEPDLYDGEGNKLPAIYTTAAGGGTLAKSIQNPSVFYKLEKVNTGEKDEYGEDIIVNNPKTGDWTSTSNDDYWGGVSGKKTIYDPCPVGYKVPVCDADGNTPYAWLVFKQMTWDTVNYGAVQDGQWFPATGTRVNFSGGFDFADPAEGGNPYSGLWIGTAGKTSSNLEEYPDLYGQYMFIINGKRTFKCNKDRRSQGLSLRCVAE